jgi:hypothetical protein
MSTANESEVREALTALKTDAYPETGARALGALDALLAEHRAEVERLRTALKARRTKMDASARDAALEEVATEATRRAGLARRVYVGTEEAAMGDGAGAALETLAACLRASKSAPVSVLPVDKVREVCASNLYTPARGPTEEAFNRGVLAVAHDLGADLDATCDCGHVSIATNSLCAVPVRTASGSVASCGCSHPSHAMPAKAEPSSTERLSAMTGVPAHLIHDEPAHEPTPGVCRGRDGVARDEHDCAPSMDETCTHGRWWDSPCSECGRGDVVL